MRSFNSLIALLALMAPAFAQSTGSIILQPRQAGSGGPSIDDIANYTQIRPYYGAIPPGLGWDSTNYPITPSITYQSGSPAIGSAGITSTALFDSFSKARSAPGATFYAAATGGSDSNNCLTSGAACASIGHAVSLCNTAAVPCTIFVTNGGSTTPIFYKGAGFTNFNTVFPTVDIAYIATGGSRFVMCFCDAFSAPSKDGTFTNTYSYTVSNVERVVDTTRRDAYGDYVELTNVATAAIANITPNSWALVAGTIYIQRYDNTAVTNANTRVYRALGGANFYLNNATQTSAYIGGATAGDGFDIEGGTDGLKTNFTTYVATKGAIVVSNATLKYGGGIVTTTGNCASVHSFNGIVAYFNVQANACAADGFNGHNDLTLSGGTAATSILTVNSAAFDNGRGTSQSNNGWTNHDDVRAIDIGGWYWGNHGGSVRDVNTSRAYALGTFVQNDFGDIALGGIQPPTAYRVDDTAQMWVDSTQLQMPAGSYAYYATSTAAMYLHNTPGVRQPLAGAGTLSNY